MAKIKIHDKPGPHTVEMFRRLGAGQIKVSLYQLLMQDRACHTHGHTGSLWLESIRERHGPLWSPLRAFPNATTMVSDVVLGASSWYEKEFIYGNLERRYQIIKQVIEPYGDTLLTIPSLP